MKNIATIYIENLRIPVIIGTKTEERESKQEIVLNLQLDYDARDAIKNDKIEDALDYENLTKAIIDFASNSQFKLLEKLADKILELIMKNPLVIKATVRIDKPQAITQAKSTAVELTAAQ